MIIFCREGNVRTKASKESNRGDKMARTEENLNIANQRDRYLDLRALSSYSSLGIPTLREYIRGGGLPYYRLRGKILIRRSDFDEWIEHYKVNGRDDLDALVEDALSSFKS